MKNLFSFLVLLIIVALVSTACSNKKIYNSETITQLELNDYINKIKTTDSLIIIDVRTAAEYDNGHYPTAININLIKSKLFQQEIEKLDKSKTVFLYCETAHRSPFATTFLKKAGFTKIYDLEKGYSQIRNHSTQK